MTGITIEDLDASCHEDVRRLILAGLGDHWGEVDESLNPDLDDMLSNYSTGRTIVARDAHGVVVGTGTVVPRSASVAEVLRMSVDRSCRRTGIGRRVLEELLATARSWGSERVVLETTSTWSDVVAFYECCGFTITHTEMGRFGSDTWFVLETKPSHIDLWNESPIRFESIDEAAALFSEAIAALSDDELDAPSALPGWTRRHVIAHVTLNAEGFVSVARQLGNGSVALMYPGGTEARDASIERLASVASAELLDRWATANSDFRAEWSGGVPTGRCATGEGHPEFASTTVPLRRLRELQVHLVDLDLNDAGIDNWIEPFVAADLPLQWPTVAHRTERSVRVVDERSGQWRAGTADDTCPVVRVSRRQLLGWVLDRVAVDGLPTLSPWSNRSSWEHLDSE